VPLKITQGGKYVARYLRMLDEDILEKRDCYTIKWIDPQPWDEVMNISNCDGSLTPQLAPRVKRITAVEASVPAIRRARLCVRRLGYSNVSFQVAGCLDFDSHPQSLSKVVVRDAMHPLSDAQRRIAIERVYRALAPSGVAVLQDIVFPFLTLTASEAFLDTLKSTALELGEDVAAEVERMVRNSRPMYVDDISAMLTAAGFKVTSTDLKFGLYATFRCVKQ
jgi:putative AdoMet-dependent methyltransferase